MSTIKSKCEIISSSIRKNTAKITIKIAALDISNSVSLLSLLNESFDMVIYEGKIKVKIRNVLFDKMSINSDGESRVVFEVEPKNVPLGAELSELQNPSFAIKVNSGGDDSDKK